MPERSWCADAERRAEAWLSPEDLAFKTRPGRSRRSTARSRQGYCSHGSPPTKSLAKPQTAPPSGRTTDRLPNGRAQEHHRHHRQPLHGTSDPAIETIAAQLETPDWQTPPVESDQQPGLADRAVTRRAVPDTSTLSDEISTMANSHDFTAKQPMQRRTRRVGPRHRFPLADRGVLRRPPSRKGLAHTNLAYRARTATSPRRYCHGFLAVLRHTAKKGGPPLWTTGSDRQHNGRIGSIISRRTWHLNAGLGDRPISSPVHR